MICRYCGTQLENDARFCSECGSAVVQEMPQYTPQAAACYNSAPIKAGVNVVYPDGHSEIGDLYFSATEITFVKKSKAVRIAFGFIGSQLENGEQALRIPVCDIVSGQKTRIGLNGNVYQITLRNGAVFKICFNRPGMIPQFAQTIGR